MCFALGRDARQKQGQVAHIDRNSDNSAIENLAYLCLTHHDHYDTVSRQSKNYLPSELRAYKEELERYIASEWNKPIISENSYIDVFSGSYHSESENSEANLQIKYVGENIVQITGMAFYGTKSEYGPNMGELDCIAQITGNKAIFVDKVYDNTYRLEVTFLGNRLAVEDSGAFGYFGAGANFSGVYYKVD
jgi:hypothetical protein